jgi:hypothetical protein
MEFDKETRRVIPQTADNIFGHDWKNYRAEELTKWQVRLHHRFTRHPVICWFFATARGIMPGFLLRKAIIYSWKE